jgi:hypothetical protein
MREGLEIILNEYRTIFELRQRCIKNIEESMKTYLLFVGFIVTAFSFVAKKPENARYAIFLFFVCGIVGFFIYRMIVESHINFIVYTRKLNKTRSYFKKRKKGKLSDHILLTTKGKKPKFDTIGFLGKKFSQDGVLKLIQLINSLISFVFLYLLINEIFCCTRFFCLYRVGNLIIAFTFALVFYLLHTLANNKIVDQAKDKYN